MHERTAKPISGGSKKKITQCGGWYGWSNNYYHPQHRRVDSGLHRPAYRPQFTEPVYNRDRTHVISNENLKSYELLYIISNLQKINI